MYVYLSVLCVSVCVCIQGVMISHDNLTWTAQRCVELYDLNEVHISLSSVCMHKYVCVNVCMCACDYSIT